ncbi:MAG: lipase family protein, partial [Pseudomonadales bacterium]|nr:lipase family protein [Pseudomonadales bacterium]
MKTFTQHILAVTLALPTVSFAASLDSLSTSITSSKQQTIDIKTDTTKFVSRSDECYRVDKITGQLVPCESKSGSGTTYDRGDTDNNTTYTHLAFNYFNSDHSEADFSNDPESVITNAYLLSQLSAISYRNPGYGSDAMGEQAYGLAEDLGLESLPVISETNVNILDLDFGDTAGESTAYIFYNDDTVFIAFQGSTGTSDWLESNIDFWPYAKPEWGHTKNVRCLIYCFTYYTNVVTIHNGFYEAMDIIFDQVLDAIEPLLEDRELWITGHSLGGAVAVLSAFRLQFDHHIDVQGVHVFGAPAVGDSDWYNVFESKMSNV